VTTTATGPAPAASPREQRRRQRQELGRAQILDAAEAAFSRKGFYETTVAEIAALAEFSVGAVYGFFADKDDLYAQVWLRRGAEFMDGMRAALGSDRTPRVRMHDLADFQVAFFRDHAAFARLFLRTAGPVIGPLGATEGTVAGNYTEAMTMQRELFRAGAVAGELRRGDPEVLASMFSGLVAAFQASDPGVAGTDIATGHPMPVAELHAILDAAFAPA
jgi:TetR/AcrR family transcriptional regulator